MKKRKKKYEEVINQFILKQVDKNMEQFVETFPSPNSTEKNYQHWENIEWTPGFWTGMIWLAYQKTEDEKYLERLKTLLPTFEKRLENNVMLNTHDIGFIFGLSVLPAYSLLGNKKYKILTKLASDKLMERYDYTTKVFQAWGDSNNLEQQGRVIIDSLLNMPLLFATTEIFHDKKYQIAACNHINRCANYLVRKDHSTHHTYYFDTLTGKAKFGKTAQGYSDDSTWARGQGWAALGFAINYKYTQNVKWLKKSIESADYFINHLPEDSVPYWDLSFQTGNEPRDSSAAAIFVCGLFELVKYLPILDERRSKYTEVALTILDSLIANYLANKTHSNGILDHGVYSIPHGNGIDECCIWGDYFFFEALLRGTEMCPSLW